MKKLREIISCIDFNEEFYLPVWEARLQTKMRLYELYRLILDNPEADDTLLCRAYLGRGLNSTYYRAKARLFDELASLLFLQSFLGANQQDRPDDWLAYRNFLLGRKLLQENKYSTSLVFLSSVRKYGKRGRIRGVVFEAMRLLRYFFAVVKGHLPNFEEVSSEEKAAMEVFQQELALSTEVESLMLQSISKEFSGSKSLLGEGADKKNELSASPNLPYQTPLLVHHRFFLQSAFWLRRGDYQRTIEICERAIRQLEQFDIPECCDYLLTFRLQQAGCYLQLNRQQEMEQVLHWLQSNTRNKAVMRVLMFELKCKWLLRQGAYEAAWNTICRVENFQVLSTMPKSQQENWLLLKGYTYFFMSSQAKKDSKKIKPFRLHKMLNDLNVLYRDKKGYYSTIVILQILFYIKDNKRDRLVDMIEALEKYIVRHLGGDKHLRTRIYMRMLLLLPKNNYCAETCREKAGFYLKQLHRSGYGLKPLSHEIEIVPYETLWNAALSLVSKSNC